MGNRERDERRWEKGEGKSKDMPFLKLKTKQAKVVIVGDLKLERQDGNERRRGEKVDRQFFSIWLCVCVFLEMEAREGEGNQSRRRKMAVKWK